MVIEHDSFVDIKEYQISYFGLAGKMLIPCQASVENLLKNIPKYRVITLRTLQKVIAEKHQVQGACLTTIRKALKSIKIDSDIPYWRVVGNSGELINYLPGGKSNQEARLRTEGITVSQKTILQKIYQFKAIQIESL